MRCAGLVLLGDLVRSADACNPDSVSVTRGQIAGKHGISRNAERDERVFAVEHKKCAVAGDVTGQDRVVTWPWRFELYSH